MTALLTRLRIAGFKSFAEPVAIDILPGLTGIVGPNGCGKSNVVEALRWAMGESSARSLRGGEMDDVIFAGTAARASRNLAEVGITLARGEGAALPDPFGAEDEITVTRRIERGAGSQYRGNGREMRARDVQTLFADIASGAKSSAMVSQGRVAALVNARPEERRAVLEEAAGITGLHARRHEAELKLRAAEANLTRAEELRAQLDTGREALRKQARQAARYRNISGLVRAAEGDFLAILHARAALAAQAAEADHAQAQAQAAAAGQAARVAAAELEAAEAALPAPRAAEAHARSLLERRRLEAETLSGDAAHAVRLLDEAHARLALIHGDLADAAALQTDADDAVARLATEACTLQSRLDSLPGAIEAARLAAADEALSASRAESHAHDSAARAAEAAAASRQAALALAQAGARVVDSAAALDSAQSACDSARAAMIDQAALEDARAAVDAAAADLATARSQVQDADQHRASAAASAADAQSTLSRETEKAGHAAAALRDATARLARLDDALAGLTRDLADAEAARVPAAHLQTARAAEEAAQADADRAERIAAQAELAHTEAGAERLLALTQRDQARASRERQHAAQADAQARHKRLAEDAASLSRAVADIQAARPAQGTLARARAETADAAQAASRADEALSRFADGRALADSALAESRTEASARAASAARLLAEAGGIREALGGSDAPDAAPLLDSINVPPGLEAAFGAIFADSPALLEGDATVSAARFWRVLPNLPAAAPPPGCTILASLVQAPPALDRALSHAALLAEGADGDILHATLPPGWRLVSAQGDVWQWDGQVCRAGAPSAAASRLRLRARLRDLIPLLDEARAREADAATAAATAEAAALSAASFEAEARQTLTAAGADLAAKRRHLAALTSEHESAEARLDSMRPALTRAESGLADATGALHDAVTALEHLPGDDDAETTFRQATARAEAAHQSLRDSRAARDASRAALTGAGSALRGLEAAAARAESQAAALSPQRDRLLAERADAAVLYESCARACQALPELASLQADFSRQEAAADTARAAVATAQAGMAEAERALAALTARATALDLARAETQMEAAAAARIFDAAETTHRRETEARDALEHDRAALPDAEALAADAAASRQTLAETRARTADLAETAAALTAALHDSSARLPALEAERAAWANRRDEAARRRESLATRAEGAAADCTALAAAPASLTARAAESGAALAAAESDHEAAADALRAADDRLRDAARAQRDADAAQSACRETTARGEGHAGAAQAALRAVLERAAERLGPDAQLPDIGLPDAGVGEAEEERARRKLDRLQRERDEMGPVNLRADIELDDIDSRIAAIDTDRDELTTAIAKLRGGIGHLNREGRQRLTDIFTQVDTHFRALFTRMMGGGRAHLALTGSDDPLEAGLEIYAEPPGKKLASLSLLSGGEQALTALSLIFAVFRCTPAPVAVLDEVDAPLDDVNVDRFCGLLEDVVRDTGTRFLVVTHHQLTMSRMDRLYGVTMQERGVSRLLSVDLRHAAEMVQPVMHAAE